MGILDNVLKGLNPEAIGELLKQQVEAQQAIATNTVNIALRLAAIDEKQEAILALLSTQGGLMRGQLGELASFRATNTVLAERLAIESPQHPAPIPAAVPNGESPHD